MTLERVVGTPRWECLHCPYVADDEDKANRHSLICTREMAIEAELRRDLTRTLATYKRQVERDTAVSMRALFIDWKGVAAQAEEWGEVQKCQSAIDLVEEWIESGARPNP